MNEIKPGLNYRPWAKIGEINRDKKSSNDRQKKKWEVARKNEITAKDHKIDEFV